MHRSLQGRSSHGQLYKSQSQLSLQQSQQQRGDGNVNQDEVREQLQFAARIVDDRLGKDSKVAALQDVITGAGLRRPQTFEWRGMGVFLMLKGLLVLGVTSRKVLAGLCGSTEYAMGTFREEDGHSHDGRVVPLRRQ